MKPKEKAQELIEKYCQILFGDTQFVSISQPKKCALIAVGLLLSNNAKPDAEYWEQVKEEINKL